MMENRTLLLTGVTGFIGSALARHFAGKGWKVIGTSRNIPEQKIPGVIYETYDLKQPQVNDALFRNVDVFIHAAFLPAGQSSESKKINLHAAQRLTEAARRNGVKKNIFLSSLAAHDEARSEYGKQKREIEKLFSGANDAIVRPGLVLGQGGLFGRMKTHLQNSRMIPLFGNGKQPIQTVYIDDLIEAVDRVVDHNISGAYTICEPQPVTYRQFYTALCETIGVQPKFVRVPYSVVLAGISAAKLIGKKIAIDRDNVLGLKKMIAWDSSKDLKRLELSLRSWRESLDQLK